MGITVEELVTNWGFEVDDKPLDDLKKKTQNMVKDFAIIGAAVGAAAGTMFGFAKTTADAGDNARKTAQALGVTTEAVQELEFAAKKQRIEFGELRGGMETLAQKMRDSLINTTGGAATAFARLGVKVADANGNLLPTDQVLGQLSDRFKGMQDGAVKTAVSMELLGGAGSKMIPFLNQGSAEIAKMRKEANELGFVISDADAAIGEQFNEELTRAQAALTGLRNIIGNALIPAITPLIQKFIDFIKVNKLFIAQRMETFFAGLSKFVSITWKFAKALFTSMEGLVRVFGGFERVATAAGIALAVFAGAKILFGIGQMVQGLAGLSKMLTLVNLKALLIPTLIGAAVVALGLVIEDIVAFFQGRNSVTGIIVQKFSEMFDFLDEKFNGLSQPIKTIGALLLNTFLAPIRLIISAVRTLGAVVGTLSGGGGFSDVLDVLKGAAASNVRGILGTGSVRDMFGFGDLSDTSTGVSQALGFGPSSNNVPGNTSNQVNNSVNMPMTINVGEGANAAEVGRVTRREVNSEIAPLLRGAERAFSGSRGY